jgi:molybdate/tungstate transport system substrate-binding protein
MPGKIQTVALGVALILVLVSCGRNGKGTDQTDKDQAISGNLIIFHAGSLSVPVHEIADSFMKAYPNVKVLAEAAGSRECARKITDLRKPCDIMISSDYQVIDQMLIPEFSGFNIKFATNEMVIAYLPDSKFSNKINLQNWPVLLARQEVTFGRSDPNSDPCGYRTLMVLQLANKYYHKPDLAVIFEKKDLRYVRPKEVDLLALLESRTIDYVFIYKSVACQHNLRYITLPDEINLKKPEMSDLYAKAEVKVSGKKPGEYALQKGEAMVYSITMLKKPQNPQVAMVFMKYFLDRDKGMKIVEKNCQPSVVPCKSETFNQIPENLKKFALP